MFKKILKKKIDILLKVVLPVGIISGITYLIVDKKYNYFKKKDKNTLKSEDNKLNENLPVKDENEKMYFVFKNDGVNIEEVSESEFNSYKGGIIMFSEFYDLKVLKVNDVIRDAINERRRLTLTPSNGKIDCELECGNSDLSFNIFCCTYSDKELYLSLAANNKCLEARIMDSEEIDNKIYLKVVIINIKDIEE